MTFHVFSMMLLSEDCAVCTKLEIFLSYHSCICKSAKVCMQWIPNTLYRFFAISFHWDILVVMHSLLKIHTVLLLRVTVHFIKKFILFFQLRFCLHRVSLHNQYCNMQMFVCIACEWKVKLAHIYCHRANELEFSSAVHYWHWLLTLLPCSPRLRCNALYPPPCIRAVRWITTHFLTPKGWKAELADP